MEQQGLFVGGDPDAGIANREPHNDVGIRCRHEAGADDDLPPLGELDGVSRQVDEYLAQPAGIAAECGRQPRLSGADKLDILVLGAEGHGVGEIIQRGGKVEVHDLQLELSGFDLGEVQHVVEDAEKGFAAGAHGLGAVALLAVELGVQQQAGHADDAVHGRPDFVAHVGQELALGDARAFRFRRGVPQFRIGFLRAVSRED